MDQQTLIDRAHESRVNEKLKSGVSTLTFFDEPLDDEGIHLLLEQRPDLEGLYLMKTQITDACVPFLSEFSNLRSLNVNQTNLSAAAVVELIKNLRVHEWILLPEHFTTEVSQAIASNHEILSVSAWQRKISDQHPPVDDTIIELAKSRSLRKLDIRGFPISGKCIESVSMLALDELALPHSGCPAEPLGQLTTFGQLEMLHLSGTKLNDESLIRILERVSIGSLFVDATAITDASVDIILATQSLKAVSFEGCEVSDSAALKLAEMRTIEYICLPEDLIPRFQEVHGGDVHYD